MIVYGNAATGFGRQYSGFAGGGRTIFGPYSFAESWSSDDFDSNQQFNNWVKPYLDQVGATGMTWDPPTSTLRTNAATKLAAWKNAADSGDATADAYVQQIDAQMKDLINRADQLSLAQSLGHRTEGVEVSRYQTFQQIVALMKKLVASQLPVIQQVITAPPVTQAATQTRPVASSSPLTSTQPSLITQPTGVTLLGGGGGMMPMSSGTPGWVLPAAIGGGVLVVGGLIFLLTRKKKAPAMAGYSRRSRRRIRR